MLIRGEGTYIVGDTNDTTLLDIVIGKYTSIAENITFYETANHPSVHLPNQVMNYPPEKLGGEYQSQIKRSFRVGNDVWIGKSTTLMAGCNIGDGAIIGAFSVVRGRVPAYSVVFGNPAKIIRFRFSPEIIKKLLQIEWWNWDHDKIVSRLKDFEDVNNFVEKYA